MQEREQDLSLEVRDQHLRKMQLVNGLDPYEIPTKEWACILDQLATMQVF